MKPLSQSEFDQLLARRVNLIAKTMQDIANTADNNPTLITAEKFGKVLEHLGTVEQNMAALVEAAINRPQPVTVGEFTLGEVKTRKPRAVKVAKAVETVNDGPEELTPPPAVEEVSPTAPVNDDAAGDLSDDDLEALLA